MRSRQWVVSGDRWLSPVDRWARYGESPDLTHPSLDLTCRDVEEGVYPPPWTPPPGTQIS